MALLKTQHATDRRASQLIITADGENILKESRQQVSEIINNMFGMLTAEELQTLRTIFLNVYWTWRQIGQNKA